MPAAEFLAEARRAREAGDAPACREAGFLAVVAASDENDWPTLYHALACVGRLHLHRAEPQEAEDWFREALEAAKRHGLVEWIGPAEHDVFLALRDQPGRRDEAMTQACRALEAYGHRHPRLSAFVADMAALRHPAGQWGPYFRPFTGCGASGPDRVVALTHLLGSAAERADRKDAARLWAALRAAIEAGGSGVGLCLTYAAAALADLGMMDAARTAASQAREVGAARRERRVERSAERLLSSLGAATAPLG